MVLPRWFYFYFTAFLAEASIVCALLAQPFLALDRWNAGPAQLGRLGLITGACYGLTALGVGFILTKVNIRMLLAIGAGGPCVMIFAQPHVSGLGAFMALVALQVGLMGCFWPAFQKRLAETYPTEDLPRALGRFNVSWCLGSLLGVWACGHLYETIGPAAPFRVAAMGWGLTLAIVALGRPPGAPATGGGTDSATVPSVRSPREVDRFVHRAWLGLAAAFFFVGLLTHLFPTLARQQPFALSPSAISRLHALRQLAMIAGFFGMGATTVWHFRRFPLHICLGLVVFGALGLSAAPSVGWFAGAFVAIGLATGIAFALSIYYALYRTENRGAYVGVHEAMLSLAFAAGPVVGGKVQVWTDQARFPYWLCFGLLGCVWVGVAVRDGMLSRRSLRSSGASIQESGSRRDSTTL
jgi:MFS family permease